MIALLFGTVVMVGVGIGWYGHKASLRIELWGRRADERDLIFQQMSESEDPSEIWATGKRRSEEASCGAPMVSSRFPVAVAASK